MCLQQIAVVSTKRKFNDVEKEDDENEDEDNKISRLLAEQSGISQLDAAGFVTILLYVYVCTVCTVCMYSMYVCNYYCMTWYLCMYASIYLST